MDPLLEWRQIFREVWRKQRDHFWRSDMGGIDWEGVYKRYEPLLSRIGSRRELSDLIGELQGELSISHTFCWGGDMQYGPGTRTGFLGADISYNQERNTYVIERILSGDSWDKGVSSPLAAPGVGVQAGDEILAINGRPLSGDVSHGSLVLDRSEVSITVVDKGKEVPRSLTVKPLSAERPLRYRDWVRSNHARVSKLTDGQVGYIHLPNMEAKGYTEFHRAFPIEGMKDALILDIRFNTGGYITPLLLQRLTQKRWGRRVFRWGREASYPWLTPRGRMVGLINEYVVSDAEIFAHSFSALGLGKMVGKRTEGSVVGTVAFDPLIDGGGTTQPEAAFFADDTGLDIENHGVTPDIEVEYPPHAYHLREDPQLEVAIREAMSLLT